MNVRLATIKDEKAVLSLLDELIAEVNKRSNKPPKYINDSVKRSQIYKDLVNNPSVKIFVIEDDREVVGVADLFILPIMRRGSHHGLIEDFVITVKKRGKGIGTTLFTAIKDYCNNKDIKVIKLTSGLELTRAHQFYKKIGGKFTEKMFRFEL